MKAFQTLPLSQLFHKGYHLNYVFLINLSKENLRIKYTYLVMQREHVEAESVTHNYYNSSTKPKFYKNTRLAGKIIEKISLTNFY